MMGCSSFCMIHKKLDTFQISNPATAALGRVEEHMIMGRNAQGNGQKNKKNKTGTNIEFFLYKNSTERIAD